MNSTPSFVVIGALVITLGVISPASARDGFAETLPKPVVIQEPGIIDALYCGDRIGLVSKDGSIEFRDPLNGQSHGKVDLSLSVPSRIVGASPDGSVLYAFRSGDESDTGLLDRIEAIQASNGRRLWSVGGLEEFHCLAVSSDGKMIAVGGSRPKPPPDDLFQAAEILLLRTADGTELGRFQRDESSVIHNLAFSPCSKEIAAGYSDDGALVIWNRETKKARILARTNLEFTDAWTTSVVFDETGRLLASNYRNTVIPHQTVYTGESITAEDSVFTLWAESGELLFTKSYPAGCNLEVTVHPSGNGYLALESFENREYDKGRRQFRYASPKSRITIWSPGMMVPTEPFDCDQVLRAPAFSRDGRSLLALSWMPPGDGWFGYDNNSPEWDLQILVWSLPPWLTGEE